MKNKIFYCIVVPCHRLYDKDILNASKQLRVFVDYRLPTTSDDIYYFLYDNLDLDCEYIKEVKL